MSEETENTKRKVHRSYKPYGARVNTRYYPRSLPSARRPLLTVAPQLPAVPPHSLVTMPVTLGTNQAGT